MQTHGGPCGTGEDGTAAGAAVDGVRLLELAVVPGQSRRHPRQSRAVRRSSDRPERRQLGAHDRIRRHRQADPPGGAQRSTPQGHVFRKGFRLRQLPHAGGGSYTAADALNQVQTTRL